MSNIIFTRGLPASGKSTWAKAWVAADPENRVRINKDTIRHELFGDATRHDKTASGLVAAEENNQIQKAVKAGKDIILDNTYVITPQVTKKLKFLRNLKGVQNITHRDFPITLEEAKRRNSQRERQVPEEIMDGFSKFLGPKGQFPVFPGTYPTTPVVLPETKNPTYAFDMDGTLVDTRDVVHWVQRDKDRDYDSFHRLSEFSPANESVKAIALSAKKRGYSVIITTARSEDYRETTQKWLDDHNVPYDNIFMRPRTDSRPDYFIKKDMFAIITEHYRILKVVDDNPQAIQAWKEVGASVIEIPYNPPHGVDLSIPNPLDGYTGKCKLCGRPVKNGAVYGPICVKKAFQ